jgi:hypothetical protein
MSGRRPNLFILGSHRCGTTAMFEFLGEHPQIHPADLKEPHYFTPWRNARTLDEYLALFAGATSETWLLEATPEYLHVPDAPRRIRELSPEARGIVMVRDPVDQLRSLYDHRALYLPDPVGLAEAGRDAQTDELFWRRVHAGEGLERLLSVFPRSDVHVVVFDDFREDNAREYRRVLEFLEVDPSFTPRFRTVWPTSVPRSRTLQRILWGEGRVTRTVARRVVPERLRKAAFEHAARLNRRRERETPLDVEVARELWRRLEADVELLSRLLDRDLVSLWRR